MSTAPRTGVFRTLWRIASPESRRLITRVLVWRAVQSCFAGLPLAGVVILVVALKDDALTASTGWTITALGTVSLAGHWFAAARANQCGWPGAMQVAGDLRIQTVEKLRRLPASFHRSRSSGDTLTALTSDTAVLESYLIHTLPNLAGALTTPVVVTAVLIWYNPLLALAVLVSMVAAFPVWSWAMRRFSALAVQRQDVQAATTSAVLEYIQGMPVLRAFSGVQAAQDRLKGDIERSRAHHTRLATRLTPPMLLFSAVVELGIPLVLIAIAWSLQGATATLSVLILFAILVLRIYSPVLAAAGEAETLRLARASLDRLARIMDAPEQPAPDRPSVPANTGIRVQSATVQYENQSQPVLRDITLDFPPGTTTAIVGHSGAGKTTLLRAIASLQDTTSGCIEIGGVDVRDLTAETRFEILSMVLQDTALFTGTVAENIALARPHASSEEIEAAARAANAHEFITAFPDGYATDVGEGGNRFSGGERQRLCIARAVLKDAPILLLDEYTASLDATNDRAVRGALQRLSEGRTVIVVAHRLSTIRHADRIVVLGDGRVRETGTHDELVAAGGTYSELWSGRERAAGWRISNSTAG